MGMMIEPAEYSKFEPIDCRWYDSWRDEPDDFEARARAFIEDFVQRGVELMMSDHIESSFLPTKGLIQQSPFDY